MSSNDGRRVGVALTIAVASISFAAIFFRKASPTHPLTSAGIRLAIACVALSPFTIRAIRAGRLPAAHLKAGLAAGLLYGLHFGAWVWSLELTTVAASVTLVTATPLLLAIVGVATGRDRPSGRLWGALTLAAIGVSIIGGTDLLASETALQGDALALLGCAAIAGYLLVARGLGNDLDVLGFTGIATGVGAVVLLGTAVAIGVDPLPASNAAWGWLALSALLPQMVGHSLLTWSLRHTTPTVVGLSTVGEPVGSTVLGVLLLNEIPGGITVFGCAVTLSAVVLALTAGASHEGKHQVEAP
ncbi:MAG: DMT family transporter [Proteobacteria bacterium]|nr:DMT family transporter [Pseudomonadota bacterium]